MTTHEHDFDTIAAVVSEGGRLDPASEACEVCRGEYAAQQEIKGLLAAPLPEMSGPERAEFRAGVHSSVGRVSNRGMRRWVAAASIAAGLLVVVGIGPVLNEMQGGGDTAELAADTTAAAETDDGMRAMSPEESVQAPAAGADMAIEDPGAPIRDGGSLTIEQLEDLEDLMRTQLEQATLKLGAAEYSERERVVPPCLPEDTVFGSIEADIDGRPVVSFLLEEEDGTRVVERFDAETCELLTRR